MPTPQVTCARRLMLAGLLCAALSAPAVAQDLPVVTYTINQGLPHDVTNRLLLDPQGFLWIAGPTALARFDGQRFAIYARAAGLDVGTGVNDVRPGTHDDLWIATNGAGLFRLDLATRDRQARFTQTLVGEGRAANRVNTFLMPEAGTTWAATDGGLFVRREPQPFVRVPLPVAEGHAQDAVQVVGLLASDDSIIAATSRGVHRCTLQPAPLCDLIAPITARSIVRGSDGRLWMGGVDGVRVARDTGGLLQMTTMSLGGPYKVRRLAAVSDGIIAATEEGRAILFGASGPQTLFASAVESRINDIAEDAARNLWLATSDGLVSVRRQGVTIFDTGHGLRQPYVRSLRTDRAGRAYVLTEDEWLYRVGDRDMSGVRLVLPAGFRRSIWSAASMSVGKDGAIWVGSANGLLRFGAAAFSADSRTELTPLASYSSRDGLAGDHIGEIFEDSRGDRWIASMPAGNGATLTVWRKASGRFQQLGAAEGLPPFNQPAGFVEDGRGGIWALLREGGLLRIRDGRGTVFSVERGLPPFLLAAMVDHQGRLWIGGGETILRIDDPAADDIAVTRVGAGVGTTVRSLAEDPAGTIFVGTYEGLFALDTRTSALRRFTAFDGLPRGAVDALAWTAGGSLLAVAGRTLARIVPAPEGQAQAAPRCMFVALSVGSREVTLPEAGVERLASIDVLPAQNTVQIEFLGLSPRLGEPLTYEYRLTGITDQWVRANEPRVTLAGLAPGDYRFEVRAAAVGRPAMSQPAAMTFTVLPPWYRRSWFIVLSLTAAALVAYRMHRARLARALRTERLRARIATDLHDDIGSSLSQIAILAEVARRRAGVAAPGVAEPLASIATTSRDLVDAMSDIVWAVNPRTDGLSDLTRRMHRFAEEILDAAGIALTFSAPPLELDLKLGADLRRELYLILKESVNNIARHSAAATAIVALALARQELTLTIADDGRGFDVSAVADGNGIASMRKRASAFGGVFTIESRPGRGTRVSLRANLRLQ